MKFSMLSYVFNRYPLEKAFQVASSVGFDGIEIWGARPHAYPIDMDQEEIDNILRMKDQYELEISMYSPEVIAYPYNIATPFPKEREDTVRYLKRAIEVAKAIGTERVQLTCGLSGYHCSRKEYLKNMYSVMHILAEHAQKHEIKLIVETITIMEGNALVMLDDLVDLLEEMDSPYVRGMIDTVSPCVHWEPFSAWFEKLGDNLDYIHFADSDGHSDIHLPSGDGVIPMQALMDMIHAYNYDGWLSTELVLPYIKDPELYIRQEFRSVKELVKNAKVRY